MSRPPSIRRQLMNWLLAALCVGALVLVGAAYRLSLIEFNEVLDDSLRQTALLLADRDLAGSLSAPPAGTTPPGVASADTESKMVAIARRLDGTLLYTSEPEIALRFEVVPGASTQRANADEWDVFTVVQSDRVVQVAQPTSVRREGAGESATRLLVPLAILGALFGVLLVVALRRALQPLGVASDALAKRSATSLEPLALDGVPLEILPVVRTLNDLLRRLGVAFEAQRNFVADAAHELRSPVTALQLQAQILEQSRDAQERAQASNELAAGIARVRRLIEQLLHLSRATADETARASSTREPVDLAELARAAVVRWIAEAERCGIDLGAQANERIVIEGHAAQLEILLNNLVENALRYTPRGGVVDVVAQLHGGTPTLGVIDDGPGIAAAERERVFDRFYRSPETIAGDIGSGLGLAIVRSIAEQHGAVVSLHAGRDGRGLEARVTFAPAARPR
ncbi:MAG TPA: ATP-binding protein [Burkholderiaceae bacterium]|jgi:signal transduction histidine kinase